MNQRISLDRRNLTLDIRITPNGESFYRLDLERCASPTEMLDWIYQIHGKDWCDAELIHELLTVLDILSGGIQGTSFTTESCKGFNWKQAVADNHKELRRCG